MHRGFPIALLLLLGCSEVSGLSDFVVATDGAGGRGGDGIGGGGGQAGGAGGGEGGAGGLGPWTMIRSVNELNTSGDEDDPTFTSDGLELYFNRVTSGATDIFMSTRGAVGDVWEGPTPVDVLGSTNNDSDLAVSPNGLFFVLGSTRTPTAGDYDLWIASRADRADPWPAPTAVTELNTTAAEIPSYISDDGLYLVFRVDDGSGWDVFQTQRGSTTAMWDAPTPFDIPGTGDPWFSADRLTMFVRDNGDIGRATRASTSDAFGALMLFEELDSGREGDPWLAPDLRFLMFARGPAGNRDIYEAYR